MSFRSAVGGDPKNGAEIRSYTSKDGYEVSFKCSNCLLCCISSMHDRRDELELNFPPVSNGCLLLLAAFIGYNVEIKN